VTDACTAAVEEEKEEEEEEDDDDHNGNRGREGVSFYQRYCFLLPVTEKPLCRQATSFASLLEDYRGALPTDP
jgi:hypothetical protein